jgi:chromosome segregation ATPase
MVNANQTNLGQSQISKTPSEDNSQKNTTLLDVKCSCGKVLKLRPELSGKKIRCLACRSILTVPGQSVPSDLFHKKLEEKIIGLAKKLEEEQVLFNKSIAAKDTELKALKGEFSQKETAWNSAKKSFEEELNSIKKDSAEKNNAWQKKQNEYAIQIAGLKEQASNKENELRLTQLEKEETKQRTEVKEKNYQEQINELKKQLTQKETETKNLQSEKVRINEEWESKTSRLEKEYNEQIKALDEGQTQFVEEEIANLEKKLNDERLIWRSKLNKNGN